MTEEHYFEHGILKTVGNITNNQTFFNTYLSNDLLVGRENGTIETSDGQKVTWSSSDHRRLRDNQLVFYGVMLFINTSSKSLSLLNNSIALSAFISLDGTGVHLDFGKIAITVIIATISIMASFLFYNKAV